MLARVVVGCAVVAGLVEVEAALKTKGVAGVPTPACYSDATCAQEKSDEKKLIYARRSKLCKISRNCSKLKQKAKAIQEKTKNQKSTWKQKKN